MRIGLLRLVTRSPVVVAKVSREPRVHRWATSSPFGHSVDAVRKINRRQQKHTQASSCPAFRRCSLAPSRRFRWIAKHMLLFLHNAHLGQFDRSGRSRAAIVEGNKQTADVTPCITGMDSRQPLARSSWIQRGIASVSRHCFVGPAATLRVSRVLPHSLHSKPSSTVAAVESSDAGRAHTRRWPRRSSGVL